MLGGYRAGDVGGDPLWPGGAGGGDEGCGLHPAQGAGTLSSPVWVTAQLGAEVPALPGHHLQESQALTTSIHPTKVAFILQTSLLYSIQYTVIHYTDTEMNYSDTEYSRERIWFGRGQTEKPRRMTTFRIWFLCYGIEYFSKGTRQKKWKIPHWGGGPDPGIFHISKKKWCLKCILSHFTPF